MSRIKSEVATRRIESFEKRFGTPHLYLAYHAAFPLALTPNLLYRLWTNFQRDIHGEMLGIPWIAVGDLLLSILCDEVGHELYEMDVGVRNVLLKQLQEDKKFGQQRIHEVSDFLLDYVKQQLESDDPDIKDFAQAQQWTALAYTQPSKAARELALAFLKLDQMDKAEIIRMASLIETFIEPLDQFQDLVIYARGMEKFARGNLEAAKAELSKVLEEGNQIHVAGVSLPIPEQIKPKQRNWLLSGRSFILAVISILMIALFAQPRLEYLGQNLKQKNLGQDVDVQEKTKLDFVSFKGHSSDVNSVAFSPDGTTLASVSDDKTIKLWNLASKKEIHTLKGHSSWIWTVAFSPDGKILASGSADKTIKLWDVDTGKLISTLKGDTDGVTSVAFSPDGKILASGSLDKTIKLWNVTGKLIRTLEGHTSAISSVVFSPDGKTLASGSWDKTIKLWNLETGKLARTLEGNAGLILSVAFAPDGKTLASGNKDKTIKLWNLQTGELMHTLKGHNDKVNSVAFLSSASPNSLTLVSGSSDKTIKLWNPVTGQEIRTLEPGSGYIYGVAISPDGHTIAGGGSGENILKIWQMP
jgi:hypothetical protein